MLSSLENTLLTAIIDLLPLAIGFHFRNCLSRELKVLLIFISIAFSTDIVLIYCAYHKMPNMGLVSIYSLLEFGIFYCLFSIILGVRRLNRFLWGGFLTLTFLPTISLAWVSLSDLLHMVKIAECAILISLALYTLYSLIHDDSGPVLKEPKFWIATGVLIYFSGNALFFTTLPFLKTNTIWTLHLVLNLIANLFYTGGFLSRRRLTTGRSSSLEPELSLP